MSLFQFLQQLLAKLKALIEAILDRLDPDSVAIEGAAIQNEILTVDESDIDHDNGEPFTYQWLADGENIEGANTNSYALTQDDVGKQISLALTYTNEQGDLVTLTSDATVAVANVNDDVTGALLVSGLAAQNETLVADTSDLADLDGLGAFNYQWYADGVAIDGATGATYELTQADVGKAFSVTVNYVDGFGAEESITSQATAPVANVNDAVTGEVIIQGTPAENQILAADASALGDIDGLGEFTYQWLADGAVIEGATGATYELTQADVGKSLTVTVSYIDGFGAAESVTSAATAAVENVNNAVTGEVVIQGIPAQYQILAADASALGDIDGLGEFTYQWLADGAVIEGATGATYELTQADVGKSFAVAVSYIDAFGAAESVTSAVTDAVANVNDAVTGDVVIQGTPTESQTLTADASALGDIDGLGVFNYQWQADGVDIDGANADSYVLTQDDVGKVITVVVSYVDGFGAPENVASAATEPVIADVDLNVTDPSVVLLEADNIYVNNVLQDPGIETMRLSAQNDQLIVNDVINGLSVDMGGEDDLDIIDLRNITGVTYTASSNNLQDGNGNSLTVTNAEAFHLGLNGNTFVIDQGGDYNFIIDGNVHNANGLGLDNTIKMIEGTGETNVSFAFQDANPDNLPNGGQIQKLSLDMEFNNAGPNIDNVATLDFAEGSYSFNATAIEYGLIAALLAQPEFLHAFFGELKINLTDSDADPIAGNVTALVTGLRDQIIDTTNGDFSPLMTIQNLTDVSGIADLTAIETSVNPNQSGLPFLSVNWVGDGKFSVNETIDASLSSTSLSNSHFFINFQELYLPGGNDNLLITTMGNNNFIDMGESLDNSDFDSLYLSGLSGTGANYDGGNNGLLTHGGNSMNVVNVEQIIGTTLNDVIIGDAGNNTIEGNQGADQLSGGGGNNTFAFGSNSGQDVINDYNLVNDSLLFKDGVQIQNLQIVGNDTVLDLGAGNNVTLIGVQVNDPMLLNIV
ncbi:hypothetical protein [Legionella spiritensis]|uniref:hypothetical protein n=1 Tax=Legionella spiritensis TaxID=452 RepID=UPI000F6C8FB7|nr:hypothetical protein [Legionella spiritensis]VEG90114.1 Uncharacterised protein [Legionella spiritensis]